MKKPLRNLSGGAKGRRVRGPSGEFDGGKGRNEPSDEESMYAFYFSTNDRIDPVL